MTHFETGYAHARHLLWFGFIYPARLLRENKNQKGRKTLQSTIWCERIKEASKSAITPQTLNISLSGSSNHTDLNKTRASDLKDAEKQGFQSSARPLSHMSRVRDHVRPSSAAYQLSVRENAGFNVLIGILIVCSSYPLSLEAINKHVVSERISEIHINTELFVLITDTRHMLNSGK